ncbi:protein MMS22-like isoform X1 [Neopelma chrysocephalum]|uniref:protein MMS22-like isoform X1 n=1 Tax=Neopelma chrysocephalum TaxID=114329 RepID=UPI000FCD4799|nr:protein MMS22-like isoform X1 [Neopelma chrysocephalum]XP_027550531.1 protein MMS22-like isoform X1 [Neopelma chrysocephalum]XP_027550540.1 protein MMS22-like isoform X1 [Neopelma chrysocephalum]XP_027550550.1 protein MMS22-like isoform X1 [Neopelma chrysocephalum]
MEDEFEALSTPPFLTESLETAMEVENEKPPCFCCAFDNQNGGRSFSAESYLANGSLKRVLLRLDPSPNDYEEDVVEMFGFQWVTEMALVESCGFLFGLLRQQICRLENLVQMSSSDFGQAANLHSEAESIRHQCIKFLHYVKVFIFRYLEPPKVENVGMLHPYEELEAQLPSVLVEELHALTMHIGHLCELPSSVLAAFTIQHQAKVFPPSWHLLHLHLDINWLILEVLHVLGEKMMRQVVYANHFINLTGENLTSVSLFEKHCGNLISDLISLSINKYTKVRPSEALTSHHYPCTCIKELWILLIQLLDHRSKGSHTECFWSLVNKTLKNIFERPSSSEGMSGFETVQCKDPLSFSWWILSHLASLYQFDRNGNLGEKKQKESNWKFVEELLKKSTDAQTGVLEEHLRMHLQCCLTLCSFWDLNLSIVTILWDYYSKNLNSGFTVPWLGLKDLANVNKTSLSMLELVKHCCCEQQIPSLYKSSNSYFIFLCILARMIKEENSGVHPWKQIKGRIYSKFHRRRMQELTEVGLQNFFNLFLMLAIVAETEDIVSRVLDLLDFLAPSSITVSQRALIWRGHFAFLLIYVEKNMDISVLAEKISSAFREKAKEFLVNKNDYTQRHSLWTLLSTYIDGVQEAFETSCYLSLSEEKLLNDGFTMLLPACRGAELSMVLNFLQVVLARLRSVHERVSQGLQLGNTAPDSQLPLVAKEHHLAVASALWRNFFPYLKSQRMSQMPPSPQLADTAAGFTLLALDIPSKALSDLQPQPVLSMMQLFGWDDMVWPQLVSRYLSHLIQNSSLCEAFSSMGYTSYEALTVRSWFRCVLQMFIDQPSGVLAKTDAERTVGKAYMEQLTEMTRLIFKLSEVENILSKAHVEESVFKQDPKYALVQFIKAVGRTYSGLQTLPEKSAMVAKTLEYLGDVLKYVKPYLKAKGPPEGLQLTYWIIGCLVKFWAPILATSKAQQLLFRIVDCLLLPHSVLQQDKELPVALLSAIQESLPLYLQGLSFICCQSQTQGAYLNQLLGSIIRHYFGRFLPSYPTMPGTGQHPMLTALCSSIRAPQMLRLRKTTLHIINENYMQFKGNAPPPRLASVLAFILEVLQRTQSTELCDIELVLPSVLKCMVLVNELQVKKISTDIVQNVVEGCQAGSGGEHATQLTSVFRQFIQDYTAVYDHRVFSILETVAVLDQMLVTSLIPTITQSLKDSEYKQGLGRNTAQREAYKRLLSYLAEAGQNEIQKLENETD